MGSNSTEKNALQVSTKNSRYDLKSYLKTIPTDKKVIDTLKLDRNDALYELGIIYKEQLKDSKLAIQRLERVAGLNPKKELILPINWHLHKLYSDLKDATKANKHKKIILSEYPKTKFAQILRNPNKPFEEEISIDELQELYKEIYYIFKEDKFEETVAKIDTLIPTIQNSKLIPKFELLKAYAIGKYKEKEAYKIALDFIAVSYGSTEEGKKAKELVLQLNK